MRKASLFEACIVILLIVLGGLLLLAMTSPPPAPGSWELNGSGKIDYMTVGEDDTLYTFQGSNLTAIRSDGSLAWTYQAPANWSILNTVMIWTPVSENSMTGDNFYDFPILAEDSGNLYLYEYRNITPEEIEFAKNSGDGATLSHPAMIKAISAYGRTLWEYPFNLTIPCKDIRYLIHPDRYAYEQVISIRAQNGQVYLFHDNVEEVVSRDGRLLFSIPDVSAPMAVDEDGYLYGVSTNRMELVYSGSEAGTSPGNYPYLDLMLGRGIDMANSADVVEAYYPNGTLAWREDIVYHSLQPYVVQDIWQQYNTLPLYCNGTLYVPIRNGVVALKPNGEFRWACQIPGGEFKLFEYMPVDEEGNVYMKSMSDRWIEQETHVRTITPQGYVMPGEWTFDGNDDWSAPQPYVGPLPVDGKDGIVYAVESNGQIDGLAFNLTLNSRRFGSDTVTAYDVKAGSPVWNFTVPVADKHLVTLGEENLQKILAPVRWYDIGAYTDSQMIRVYGEAVTNETQPLMPATVKDVSICPGNDITYINYYSAIYQSPVIFNRSQCIYAKGLYAVDNNGSLIWSMPVDGFIDDIRAGNSTVYYATHDGRIGTGGASTVAAGVTLAAFLYLFLRFFMVGAVARARNRIDQNENRSAVLQYVIDHPGASAVDLVRGLRINEGTIRYHLFVLSVNHKVVACQDGEKYLRYFRNSGTFSPEERTFLALARREPIRRTLKVLRAKPGLSSHELAEELGISNTATHRHVTFLLEKGVIERRHERDRGYVYTIKDQYRPHVEKISEHY